MRLLYPSTENKKFHGIVLAVISALLFSTAGPLTKSVSIDAWSVVFWRSLFGIAVILLYIQTSKKLKKQVRHLSRYEWIMVFFAASGGIAFVTSFKFTNISNVVLIYSSAPIFTILLAWIMINKRPDKLALQACILAMFGTALVVFEGLTMGHVIGSLLALWCAISVSVVIFMYRCRPNSSVVSPILYSALMALLIAFFQGDPFDISAKDLLVMLFFGVTFSLASIFLAEGARRLLAVTMTLISLMEIPFAIVWGWWLFSEQMSLLSLTGGLVIMFAIILSLDIKNKYCAAS